MKSIQSAIENAIQAFSETKECEDMIIDWLEGRMVHSCVLTNGSGDDYNPLEATVWIADLSKDAHERVASESRTNLLDEWLSNCDNMYGAERDLINIDKTISELERSILALKELRSNIISDEG